LNSGGSSGVSSVYKLMNQRVGTIKKYKKVDYLVIDFLKKLFLILESMAFLSLFQLD
jgi:hypothetical protein